MTEVACCARSVSVLSPANGPAKGVAAAAKSKISVGLPDVMLVLPVCANGCEIRKVPLPASVRLRGPPDSANAPEHCSVRPAAMLHV